MPDASPLIIPPAPIVHAGNLPPLKLVMTSLRNSLAIWPDYAFDVAFSRNTVFGVESVLINDPEGIRHVMVTNAANYIRPAIMPRILRPLIGHGLFLAEGDDWRRQRQMLSPSFTPHNVNMILPHFVAAATDLVDQLKDQTTADLSDAYQAAALNAVLRALFSLPDEIERNQIGGLVRQYITGPGRPQIADGFAKSESDFAFTLGRRRAFQKRWFATIDSIVASRRNAPRMSQHQDLLDLLLDTRDQDSGQSLALDQVRDQAATMIFAGYETTARLLFWATYLLTLAPTQQARIRAEVAAFPPTKVKSLDDLNHWPRLKLVLLEALRLYPPVPLIVREPVTDDVIQGEKVRRGVQVYIAPWVMQRHRKHWHDPRAFIPDRFAGLQSPWTSGGAYLPFGAGRRICIGAVFALAEAQIMLASILHHYMIDTASQRPVMPIGRLTIQPDHAPQFTIKAATPR